MGASIALANAFEADINRVICSFLDDSSIRSTYGSDASDIAVLDIEPWPAFNYYWRNQRFERSIGLYQESMEFQSLL